MFIYIPWYLSIENDVFNLIFLRNLLKKIAIVHSEKNNEMTNPSEKNYWTQKNDYELNDISNKHKL